MGVWARGVSSIYGLEPMRHCYFNELLQLIILWPQVQVLVGSPETQTLISNSEVLSYATNERKCHLSIGK